MGDRPSTPPAPASPPEEPGESGVFECRSGDPGALEAARREHAVPGALWWYVVLAGRRPCVTSRFVDVIESVDGLGPGSGVHWARFDDVAAASAWAAARPARALPEPPPTTWAVYDGTAPGVYRSPDEAAEAAGPDGRARAFAGTWWAGEYARVGRWGPEPGMVDTRRCYAASWVSPLAEGRAVRLLAWLSVEAGGWAWQVEELWDGGERWAREGVPPIPPGVRGGGRLRWLAVHGLLDLLGELWGPTLADVRPGGQGGLLHPSDGTVVRLILNRPEGRDVVAAETWRYEAEVRLATRARAVPVVLTVDPHDSVFAPVGHAAGSESGGPAAAPASPRAP